MIRYDLTTYRLNKSRDLSMVHYDMNHFTIVDNKKVSLLTTILTCATSHLYLFQFCHHDSITVEKKSSLQIKVPPSVQCDCYTSCNERIFLPYSSQTIAPRCYSRTDPLEKQKQIVNKGYCR